jgi:replication factor A3
MNHAVEIVGKVKPDLSVLILASTDFGTDFGTEPLFSPTGLFSFFRSFKTTDIDTDLSAMEAVVDATHRYKEIFYKSDDQQHY